MLRTALLSAVLVTGLVAAAPARKDAKKFIEVTPAAMKWGPAPESLPKGAQAVLIEGDPGKPGFFALRLKVPAGYRIMPHTHPEAERVTVIEGTFHLGMGRRWDEKALKAYPAGSYVSIPTGHVHFAEFKEGGVIQLASLGPWRIDYVDPKDDPRRR